jgi:excisionase family DNA binding protein
MNGGRDDGTEVRQAPALARLLDVDSAAGYLSVSTWTVRDLVAAGTLPRIRVPLPGGRELRRLLIDRHDLDALIARWRAS